MIHTLSYFIFFFFNDTATTEIYTLSLHDALPISGLVTINGNIGSGVVNLEDLTFSSVDDFLSTLPFCLLDPRSEEHTSELQSQSNLVCRLLLEKKKKNQMFSILT